MRVERQNWCKNAILKVQMQPSRTKWRFNVKSCLKDCEGLPFAAGKRMMPGFKTLFYFGLMAETSPGDRQTTMGSMLQQVLT